MKWSGLLPVKVNWESQVPWMQLSTSWDRKPSTILLHSQSFHPGHSQLNKQFTFTVYIPKMHTISHVLWTLWQLLMTTLKNLGNRDTITESSLTRGIIWPSTQEKEAAMFLIPLTRLLQEPCVRAQESESKEDICTDRHVFRPRGDVIRSLAVTGGETGGGAGADIPLLLAEAQKLKLHQHFPLVL